MQPAAASSEPPTFESAKSATRGRPQAARRLVGPPPKLATRRPAEYGGRWLGGFVASGTSSGCGWGGGRV
jgi:hypothetical protein